MFSLWNIILTCAVLAAAFVNGWTDAPNAIASAVGTGAISFRKAAVLAAVFNLTGVIFIGALNTSVAETIISVLGFEGVDTVSTQAALCASMLSIVIFAVGAWFFGIPTSESHALIAALAGASLALESSAPSASAWAKVLIGLAASLLLGYLGSYILTISLGRLLAKLSDKILDKFQILSAAGMAFMHGAQDGQKFAAVLICSSLSMMGTNDIRGITHLPAFIICALFMAMGTGLGGKRIVDSVGTNMVSIKKVEGVCSDIGSSICLLAASLIGIPMSTTHTKTSAILGAGVSGGGKPDMNIAGGMVFTWVLTFPACGILGFLLTNLFVMFAG